MNFGPGALYYKNIIVKRKTNVIFTDTRTYLILRMRVSKISHLVSFHTKVSRFITLCSRDPGKILMTFAVQMLEVKTRLMKSFLVDLNLCFDRLCNARFINGFVRSREFVFSNRKMFINIGDQILMSRKIAG